MSIDPTNEENVLANQQETAGALANAAPSFLQEYEGPSGVEELGRFVRPKYLRIVQGIGPLSDQYDKGTVLLTSGQNMEVFQPPTGAFLLIPVFHWTSWGIRYDFNANMKNSIKEETFDPDSEIAKIAMDWENPEGREVDDPDHPGLKLSYQELLNYIFYLPETNQAVGITFSGGEHKTGRTLGELIYKRSENPANPEQKYPIFAGVYSATVGTHKSRDGSKAWKGFDFNNHSWISKEMFPRLKEEFQKFEKAHKARAIMMDRNNEDGQGQSATEDAASDTRF